MEQTKYDVFISYSRKDSEQVLSVVKKLQERGFTIWIDKDGIESGDAFKSVIVRAIKNSDVFLFFSSKNSNESPWTVKEVNTAVHLKKPIIPIRLDGVDYDDSILFDLVGLDFADLSVEEKKKPALNKLINTLLSKISIRQDNDFVLKYSLEEFNSLVHKGNNGNSSQPFVLPVEDVFYIEGRGIVVTGKIESGTIHVDDNVIVLGYGKEKSAVCLGIEMHRKIREEAKTGDEVGLLLKGLNETDVYRGQVAITTPTRITEGNSFSCDCYFFDNGEGYEITGSQSLKFYIRAAEVSGRLEFPNGVNSASPNDYLPVIVNLIVTVPLNRGLVFAIRVDNKTISLGIVKNVY